MRWMMAGLTALALSLIPLRARAHAELLDADPRPGATVSSPAEIRLTFTEPLSAGSAFVVYAAGFQAVPGIAPNVEAASLRATLAAPLAPGDYAVQWKAVSVDGHTTEGSYQFRVVESGGVPAWVWGLGAALVVSGVSAAIVLKRQRRSTP
jgi:methionine-rich copper-binding protein CopC